MRRKPIYDLDLIINDIEDIFEWLEELHYEVYQLKQGGSGVSGKDDKRPGVYSSFIEELYGRDINFDGSESGIKMTPWDITMEIMEESGVFDWRDDAQDVYDSLFEILVKKQNDYGPDNVRKAPGGPLNGLSVRLHDKIARLSNLLATGATPENESLRDTFVDIANYGVIGIMILDDTFPKSKDA
jgi:hypothetical protein